MKDVRTVVFEKCCVTSNVFVEGLTKNWAVLGMKDNTGKYQSVSNIIIKWSWLFFSWFIPAWVLSPPHAYKYWQKLEKRIKVVFLKRAFSNIPHIFLVSWQPDMSDCCVTLHTTIWEVVFRNCLEKGRCFQQILGRWLDESSVYHHLPQANFNLSNQQTFK